MAKQKSLFSGKCPPPPPGWEEKRWRKHRQNTKRAYRMTGWVPLSEEGWEKVAVLLMDQLDAIKKGGAS